MANLVEQTKAEVRFALHQLAARNGQHEFETLARMLARATVTRNVLPATGPVAAGGDQGRDFETYQTEMAGQMQRLGHGMEYPLEVGTAPSFVDIPAVRRQRVELSEARAPVERAANVVICHGSSYGS